MSIDWLSVRFELRLYESRKLKSSGDAKSGLILQEH